MHRPARFSRGGRCASPCPGAMPGRALYPGTYYRKAQEDARPNANLFQEGSAKGAKTGDAMLRSSEKASGKQQDKKILPEDAKGRAERLALHDEKKGTAAKKHRARRGKLI